MAQKHNGFWQGVRAASPLMPGFFPFAMITGATAMSLNMSVVTAMGLSCIVFAGASQLALMALLENNAPIAVLILTALAINLRFLIYSASMAPRLKNLGTRAKSLFAYLLTDQAFLISAANYDKQEEVSKGHGFYLGAAASIWLVWQIGTLLGIFLGNGLPPSWELDFAVPLSFLALLMPALKTRPAWLAAAVAALTMYWVHDLPLQLGLIVSAFAGILAGFVADGRKP